MEVTRVSGDAARFLAARRGDLNGRFERARRRWPRLDGDAVLELVHQVLPLLAGPEPEADALCASVYDLLLLHAGRETIASPGVAHLLRTTLPALRRLLLTRPAVLPAALSNAVENQRAQGQALSVALAELGPKLTAPEQLSELVVVAAWRLGEARLREAAFRAARNVPARVALAALGLSDWPEHTLPAAVAAVEGDAWTDPRKAITPRTLGGVSTVEDGIALARAVAERPTPPLSKLAFVGSVGDFVGFGGTFIRPPVVLAGGSRHTILARVTEDPSGDWRLDADVFGAVVSRIEPTGLALLSPQAAAARLLGSIFGGRGDTTSLSKDGTVNRGSESVRLPALAGATSFAPLDDAIVVTQADSHRIRVFTPQRDPL